MLNIYFEATLLGKTGTLAYYTCLLYDIWLRDVGKGRDRIIMIIVRLFRHYIDSEVTLHSLVFSNSECSRPINAVIKTAIRL